MNPQILQAPHPQQQECFGWSLKRVGSLALIGAKAGHGRVYAFAHDNGFENGKWHYQQTLNSPDQRGGSNFGTSLDMSGNKAIIATRHGAYVFAYTSGWHLEKDLGPLMPRAPSGVYELTVAMDGDHAVVSSDSESYVFVHGADGWTYQQTLPNTGLVSQGLAMAPGRIVIGQDRSVSIFSDDQGSWSHQQTISAPNASVDSYMFGWSVDINRETIVVGDYRAPQSSSRSGRAYVFSYQETEWAYVATLQPPLPREGGQFGKSVSVDGNSILVGAPNGGSGGGGEAYLFTKQADSWQYNKTFKPKDEQTYGWFGEASFIKDGEVFVGEYGRTLNDELNAGQVYVYI